MGAACATNDRSSLATGLTPRPVGYKPSPRKGQAVGAGCCCATRQIDASGVTPRVGGPPAAEGGSLITALDGLDARGPAAAKTNQLPSISEHNDGMASMLLKALPTPARALKAFESDPSAGHPSKGSVGHATGECKRCCFFPKGRCQNGFDCEFCHYEHEKRIRKSRTARKRASRLAKEAAERAALGLPPLDPTDSDSGEDSDSDEEGTSPQSQATTCMGRTPSNTPLSSLSATAAPFRMPAAPKPAADVVAEQANMLQREKEDKQQLQDKLREAEETIRKLKVKAGPVAPGPVPREAHPEPQQPPAGLPLTHTSMFYSQNDGGAAPLGQNLNEWRVSQPVGQNVTEWWDPSIHPQQPMPMQDRAWGTVQYHAQSWDTRTVQLPAAPMQEPLVLGTWPSRDPAACPPGDMVECTPLVDQGRHWYASCHGATAVAPQ